MNPIQYSIKQTYLALRWGILVVVLMLFVAVYLTGAPSDVWQTSISGYYHTAARPVFVATLCAIGASLVVYHADNPENLLLDFAGFLAFVVAFVPTSIDLEEPPAGTINLPTATEVADIVEVGVGSLLWAGVFAVLVGWLLWRQEGPARPAPQQRHSLLALSVCAAALTAGTLILSFRSGVIENRAHAFAAIAMFVMMFAVVLVNAHRVDDERTVFITNDRSAPGLHRAWAGIRRVLARGWWALKALVSVWRNGHGSGPFRVYVWVARLMLFVTVGLAVAGYMGFDHWIFWAESLLILLFGWFWQEQTAEFLASGTDLLLGESEPPDPQPQRE